MSVLGVIMVSSYGYNAHWVCIVLYVVEEGIGQHTLTEERKEKGGGSVQESSCNCYLHTCYLCTPSHLHTVIFYKQRHRRVKIHQINLLRVADVQTPTHLGPPPAASKNKMWGGGEGKAFCFVLFCYFFVVCRGNENAEKNLKKIFFCVFGEIVCPTGMVLLYKRIEIAQFCSRLVSLLRLQPSRVVDPSPTSPAIFLVWSFAPHIYICMYV